MERPLPCFTSSHCNTAACSLSQTEDINEDCSSFLYCEPVTETAGDQVHSSLVGGVAARSTAKVQLEKSVLVTGVIEHKTLHHKPSSAAQKT